MEAAAANAEANGVELELSKVDVREDPLPIAPTVISNLTGNLVRDCARQLAERGESPRTLVCSGMLVEETDEVSAALASAGLEVAERRVEGDWAALLLRSEEVS